MNPKHRKQKRKSRKRKSVESSIDFRMHTITTDLERRFEQRLQTFIEPRLTALEDKVFKKKSKK